MVTLGVDDPKVAKTVVERQPKVVFPLLLSAFWSFFSLLWGDSESCFGPLSHHPEIWGLQALWGLWFGALASSESKVPGRIVIVSARVGIPIAWYTARIPGFPRDQCHAEGGATKGGVSKCEQTQTNAEKR